MGQSLVWKSTLYEIFYGIFDPKMLNWSSVKKDDYVEKLLYMTEYIHQYQEKTSSNML